MRTCRCDRHVVPDASIARRFIDVSGKRVDRIDILDKSVDFPAVCRHVRRTCRRHQHDLSTCRYSVTASTHLADVSIRSTQSSDMSRKSAFVDLSCPRVDAIDSKASTRLACIDTSGKPVDSIDRSAQRVEIIRFCRHISPTCRYCRHERQTCRNFGVLSTRSPDVSMGSTGPGDLSMFGRLIDTLPGSVDAIDTNGEPVDESRFFRHISQTCRCHRHKLENPSTLVGVVDRSCRTCDAIDTNKGECYQNG